MRAHIGVDSQLKIVHSFAATPANVHDSYLLPELLHGEETRVWGDAAYRRKTALIRARAPWAADFTTIARHAEKACRSANGKLTARRRKYVLGLNIRFMSSSESSASSKFGIVESPRTHTGWSSTLRFPTSISTGDDHCFDGRSVS
jgi:IS5 family transposase